MAGSVFFFEVPYPKGSEINQNVTKIIIELGTYVTKIFLLQTDTMAYQIFNLNQLVF